MFIEKDCSKLLKFQVLHTPVVPAVDSCLTVQIPHSTQHSLAACLIVVTGMSQYKKL